MQHARRFILALTAIVSIFLPPALYAQHPLGYFDQWKDTTAVRAPKLTCRELRSTTTYDFSVDDAATVVAKDPVPEFCHVQGQIMPEVRFDVSLPRAWNGRLYMFGNGGFAGETLSSAGTCREARCGARQGFRRGVDEYGSRRVSRTAGNVCRESTEVDRLRLPCGPRLRAHRQTVGADLLRHGARAFVLRRLLHWWTAGLDFCPAFPRGLRRHHRRRPRSRFFRDDAALRARRTRRCGQRPPCMKKCRWLPPRVYEKCDTVDGAADGLLTDPRQCRLRSGRPICRAAAADASAAGCVTAAELSALQAIYGDLLVNGVPRFRGFPVGAEAAVPGAGRSTKRMGSLDRARRRSADDLAFVHGDVLQAHGDAGTGDRLDDGRACKRLWNSCEPSARCSTRPIRISRAFERAAARSSCTSVGRIRRSIR